MKINPKSQKGAITLIVLVTMLFLTAFLMTMYIRLANKAGISAETTAEIAKRYNNIGEINNKYGELVEDPSKNTIIPITNKEQLSAIGSDTYKEVNGKLYLFSKTGNYVLQDNIDLGGDPEDEDTWWTPLTDEFTGVLDGLGYTISGLYIKDKGAEEPQGLFGTLNGIVRNLNIENSSITGNQFVGAIAGINGEEALIENCYNKATVRGGDYVGGIAGLNAVNEEDSTIHGVIKDCKNTGNIIGDTHVTGGYFVAIDDNTYTPVNNIWNKTRTLSQNYKFISGEDDVAIIPKGFKVSANIDEQTISEGLVIQDSDENEFVWVPVPITNLDTATSITYMQRTLWEDNNPSTLVGSSYEEPNVTNGYSTEVDEYNEMLESVYNNKGFYIGRYEAGSETLRDDDVSNGTTILSIKKGKYPYYYVGWGAAMNDYTSNIIKNDKNQGKGAVYLSKQLYQNSNVGVTSTLIYGSQWDATLRFLRNKVNVTNSGNWGNYCSSSFYYTGKSKNDNWNNTTSTMLKPSGPSYRLTTGASEQNKAKNIYDLAGSMWEITMEAVPNANKRVARGGCWVNNNTFSASSRTQVAVDDNSYNFGFRPALYIKPTE